MEQRELILGTVIQMFKEPSFAVDLYLNYDCDINSENFFAEILDFFHKVIN